MSRRWQDRAACAGHDFPAIFDVDAPPEARTVAMQFCVDSGCPVREECLAYGLRHGFGGVWGGRNITTRGTVRRSLESRIPTRLWKSRYAREVTT